MSTTTAPNTVHDAPPLESDIPLTPDERNAMRAYLQRCEVRLSTMHRIGVAFINGAGLLILFPVFFRDVILVIINQFLAMAVNHFPQYGDAGVIPSLLVYLALLYPFVLSVGLPLFAMYMLLKDIVHFYFTIYSPDFPDTLNNPTFALSGVAFSPDESPTVKREVMRHQYSSNHINFAIPFSRGRKEQYFDTLIEQTNGDIIPSSRRLEALQAMGVIAPDVDVDEVKRFNAAFGLARILDRPLIQEVAKTEVSLARHTLYLRRLVLRYLRTLLAFIWTTLVAFVMVPFLQDERFPTLLMLSLGYFAWALLANRVMHLPIAWIYRFRPEWEQQATIDRQLMLMESRLIWAVRAARVTAFAALVASVVLYLN
ncbi:MAG: hypothetical protein SF029_16450 [bacterium]|nr:hypothetical protein [bacterium]